MDKTYMYLYSHAFKKGSYAKFKQNHSSGPRDLHVAIRAGFDP